MKLFDLPTGSKILLPIKNKDGKVSNELCTLNHLDRAYGYIATKSGRTVYLHATTSLKKVGDYYELDMAGEER